MTDIIVATFYQFTRLKDPNFLRAALLEKLSSYDVKGTVLLAPEGINGTLAGSRRAIDYSLKALRSLSGDGLMKHKESHAKSPPFYRLKVRLKKEIVTMGIPNLDPQKIVGTYVKPKDWNELIADPETFVIDARNNFEIEIGTFEGAKNPKTRKFSELPRWLDEHRAEFQGKKVAMFCTGGIRCEKATSYLKSRGLHDVFHLEGGILKYLEDIPEPESQWRGECFVFDGRVSVMHNLQPGNYEQCHACRSPVDSIGRSSGNFLVGVSCDQCIDRRSDEQRARYAARQYQVQLAEQRGEAHIGFVFNTLQNLDAFED